MAKNNSILFQKDGTIPFSEIYGRGIAGTSITLLFSDPIIEFVLTSSGGGTKSGDIRNFFPIPLDFASFPTLGVRVRTYRSIAVTTLEMRFYNISGTLISSTSVSPTSLNTYQTFDVTIGGTWATLDQIVCVLYFETTNNGSVRYFPLHIKYNK